MFPFFENYDVQETRRIAKAEGRAEGKAEGKAEERVDVASRLLKLGRPIAEIIEVTGMTREEIEQLCNTN